MISNVHFYNITHINPSVKVAKAFLSCYISFCGKHAGRNPVNTDDEESMIQQRLIPEKKIFFAGETVTFKLENVHGIVGEAVLQNVQTGFLI